MQKMLYSRNEYYGLIIDFWIKHCAQAQFIYCINIFYSKIFQSVNKKKWTGQTIVLKLINGMFILFFLWAF